MTNILSTNEKEEILKHVIDHIEQNYVFLDVAKQISETLTSNFHAGQYNAIDNKDGFCKRLTNHLQELTNDKHLVVFHRPSHSTKSPKKSMEEMMAEDETRKGKIENYGIYKIERLNGNIGYIDLRKFYSVHLGEDSIISAMNSVAHTDALIIDLRKNGGGRVEMVNFVTSYFFEEPTHITSIYNRTEDTLTEVWTQSAVPGKKYVNKPIFVLTSTFTFSGGEALTYTLKHFHKAKVIGEITGGGAHPVMFAQITESIRIKIPNRRSISPITHTNWEGTGVIPDIQIEKEKAFDYAYKEALVSVKKKYQNKENYNFLLKEIEDALLHL
jgi:C-terminal processing protease CtpA/Prc